MLFPVVDSGIPEVELRDALGGCLRFPVPWSAPAIHWCKAEEKKERLAKELDTRGPRWPGKPFFKHLCEEGRVGAYFALVVK